MTKAPVGKLDESEASLSRRYTQFERTLIQMAEYLRKTEPERAELLIRTIGKSREDRIIQQMDRVADLLKSDQLGDAVGHEEHLVANLKGLLELLQSEDRRHQLEEEKKWLESLRKEVEKLSAREKDLRKATEANGSGKRLAGRQGEIGRDAKSLMEKIDKQDTERKASENRQPSDKADPPGKSSKDRNRNGKPGDKSPGQPKDAEPKSGSKNDAKQGESKKDGKSPRDEPQKNDAKKNDAKNGDSKNNDAKKNDSQNQGKGQQNKSPSKGKGKDSPPEQQQQDGQQQEGSENESPDDQRVPRKTPGRKEIEEARRAMQHAEEELKRLQSEKALPQEDEAIRKLADAKAQLEKILRQLREEEQEIVLRSLEARCAKMLVMQLQVHFDTVTLAKTAKNAWTTRHFGRSRELSVAEDAIADEAFKALALLKEEGSSVAFPKGVEQVREDMLTIARRLEKNDVAELTQTIEKEVIESLEELLASLQSEIENRKKPEQQRQRGKPGQQQNDDKLVKDLAELKMLRSLQLRVNRRTKLIGRMIKGEQTANDDLLDQLRKLARRQAEIQEATYILASGRNQ